MLLSDHFPELHFRTCLWGTNVADLRIFHNTTYPAIDDLVLGALGIVHHQLLRPSATKGANLVERRPSSVGDPQRLEKFCAVQGGSECETKTHRCLEIVPVGVVVANRCKNSFLVQNIPHLKARWQLGLRLLESLKAVGGSCIHPPPPSMMHAVTCCCLEQASICLLGPQTRVFMGFWPWLRVITWTRGQKPSWHILPASWLPGVWEPGNESRVVGESWVIEETKFWVAVTDLKLSYHNMDRG